VSRRLLPGRGPGNRRRRRTPGHRRLSGLLRPLLDGVKVLRGQRKRDAEVDEEVAHFMTEAEADLVGQGVSPDEARRRVRLRRSQTTVVRPNVGVRLILLLAGLAGASCISTEPSLTDADAEAVVAVETAALMREHRLPGMAVAISHRGRDYLLNFGVMDPKGDRPVTASTIFEVGSITKLLTVTAASWAEERAELSLADSVAAYLPALSGTPLGRLPIFHLATHTAGGFPLQVPEGVTDRTSLIRYFQDWTPENSPGTWRHYANPSIGLLGVLVSNVEGTSFEAIMEEHLLPELEMRSSFVSVPPAMADDYAWGVDRQENRVRVNPGLLADEAYGLKTTSADLLRFLKANLRAAARDDALSRSMRRTHDPLFEVGPFQQALVWERYPYPLDPCALRAGNANAMIFRPAPVERVTEPTEPFALSKTGSTGGFGAYVLVVPEEEFALVMLANRNYPNADRAEAARRILAGFLSAEPEACVD